ncbi:MAG: carboxypeptidase-like regulatory domain-containing protein [Deltaproteobacteria bacterium]|nr:carboxypeptidase-like regulatory domain-containing protein [Deltaproteobacteria bacterium]
MTSSTATLNGSVNPNGSDTIYYFQYGTTTSYGYTTSAGSAGSGISPVSVSSNVANLSPQTTYHCRIVATNDAGTTYGQDKVFTTTSVIPATIFGTVTDSITSQPIDGAEVITDGGGETMTSADGTYIFLHPAGKWTVTAKADGYEEKSSGVQLMEGAQVTVNFQLVPLSPTDTVYVNQYDATCNGHLPCYTSLQEAINVASSGATIKIVGGTLGEDITLNNGKALKLKGGYNSAYTDQTSETVLNSMSIRNGSAHVDKLTLAQSSAPPPPPEKDASIVFYNNVACNGYGFNASFTIGGYQLNSYTGNYSSCVDLECAKSYTYSLYSDTGGCGTISLSTSETLSCDCLYEIWLRYLEGKFVLVFNKDCPGDCSGPGSDSTGGVESFKRVVLGAIDEASGLSDISSNK